MTTTLEQYVQPDKQASSQFLTKEVVGLPFVKWVGGKRSIIDQLVNRLPEKFSDYYEAFMGGAALYFEIQDTLKQAFLSDSNLDLAIAFKVVKSKPNELIAKLEEHAKYDSIEYYYKIPKHNWRY
ncbi:MAG: DNA adenine methylase, partial [Chloroflexi bacterium]|nr:DNA adenine methylase [Chloroflexota bacterium]